MPSKGPHYSGLNVEPIVSFLPKVLANHTFDANTVLVGHSGGALLLAILEHIDTRVDQAILVTGYCTQPNTEDEPVLQDAYDWAAIRASVRDLYFINSQGKVHGYAASAQVPLMIGGPGVAAGTRVQVVGNVDLPATLLDFAEAAPTLPQDGRSLRPLLSEPAAEWPSTLYVASGPRPDAGWYGEPGGRPVRRAHLAPWADARPGRLCRRRPVSPVLIPLVAGSPTCPNSVMRTPTVGS